MTKTWKNSQWKESLKPSQWRICATQNLWRFLAVRALVARTLRSGSRSKSRSCSKPVLKRLRMRYALRQTMPVSLTQGWLTGPANPVREESVLLVPSNRSAQTQSGRGHSLLTWNWWITTVLINPEASMSIWFLTLTITAKMQSSHIHPSFLHLPETLITLSSEI